MHRCDVTGPGKISRLIMEKVTRDVLSLSFVHKEEANANDRAQPTAT